jgi:Mor family transcriptional regulator
MDKEKIDQIIKQSLDELLSSEALHEIIERFLNENPSIFQIKGKGEEKADLAIRRIASQDKRLTELIQEYLTAVEAAKKNKRLPPEAKLKRLILPLGEIQDIIFPSYPKYHQFVDDRYINLGKELDLEKLKPNPQTYSILGDGEYEKLGLLNTHSKNIGINEELEDYFAFCRDVKPISEAEFERMSEEGKIKREVVKRPPGGDSIPEEDVVPDLGHRSIAEIYPDWLPTLTPETMASKDLLTQILVCYTIKRALNGDDIAIQKLYDLYKDVAQGIAVKTGMKFHVSREIEDMKQDALILLKPLIAGFRPDYILEQLLKDKSDRTIMPFPKWVTKFYIYYLSEYVPKRFRAILMNIEQIDRFIRFANDLSSGVISITDLIKQDKGATEAIEKLQNLNITNAAEWLRSRIGILGLEVVTLFNIYAPIHDGTVWKNTPKRLNRFNSYSFQPGIKKMGPRWNLTTWLFGRRKEIDTLAKAEREDGTVAKAWQPYGKLYQLLRDKYRPLIRERSKTTNFDFKDDFDEDNEESLGFRERTKAFAVEEASIKYGYKHENKISAREAIERVKKGLSDLGASHRNIEIYLLWKGDNGPTQSEIAKKYGLSRRQIIRICKQTQRLTHKVKHFIHEE